MCWSDLVLVWDVVFISLVYENQAAIDEQAEVWEFGYEMHEMAVAVAHNRSGRDGVKANGIFPL